MKIPLKIYHLSLILLLTSYFSIATAKTKVIIYADGGYQPYSYSLPGKTTGDGIYVKIIEKVFEKMEKDYDITIIAAPWQRGINATKTGEAFGLIPPYKNPSARPWLNYSEPILTEQLAVFCNDKTGKWPEDYNGKVVAINYGFSFPKEIYANLEKNQNSIVNPKNNEQALEYLYEQNSSCYINDKNSILYTAKKMKYDVNKIYLKSILSDQDGYLGYSNDMSTFPYQTDFINKFNSILTKMKEKKEIDEIIAKYLKEG